MSGCLDFVFQGLVQMAAGEIASGYQWKGIQPVGETKHFTYSECQPYWYPQKTSQKNTSEFLCRFCSKKLLVQDVISNSAAVIIVSKNGCWTFLYES